MTNKDLANLIFPNAKDISYYEEKYPERNLPEGAIVTRFAPSPTGFVHMGSLLASFISRKAAKDTNGVFYLRIEDTDQKREIENGVTGIVSSLQDFDMGPDEGQISETEEIGNYGPYVQSQRKEIYEAYLENVDLAFYHRNLSEQEYRDAILSMDKKPPETDPRHFAYDAFEFAKSLALNLEIDKK